MVINIWKNANVEESLLIIEVDVHNSYNSGRDTVVVLGPVESKFRRDKGKRVSVFFTDCEIKAIVKYAKEKGITTETDSE